MKSLFVLRRLVTIAMLLSFFVVMLGAYTRLTHAGLGCPDWPGCYGQMALSSSKSALAKAQALFPNSPIETKKAWTEMIHRYVAGALVLFIILINSSVWYANRRSQHIPWTIPMILMGFIVFQAALGMWTVTLKLLPIVVMGHLLGGILIFSSLCYFQAQLGIVRQVDNDLWRLAVIIGVVLVFCQIALGGWVSSNYAGLACIGFPQCNGQWWPALEWTKAFHLFSPIGENYQGGVLDSGARVTIQFVHRIGAVIVASYLLGLSIWLLQRVQFKPLRSVLMGVALLVCFQFLLGIINVVHLLPLWAAVLHNGIAALLLALCLVMLYLVSGEARNESLF